VGRCTASGRHSAAAAAFTAARCCATVVVDGVVGDLDLGGGIALGVRQSVAGRVNRTFIDLDSLVGDLMGAFRGRTGPERSREARTEALAELETFLGSTMPTS